MLNISKEYSDVLYKNLMAKIKSEFLDNPQKILLFIIEKMSMIVNIRPVRIGSTIYYLPFLLNELNKYKIAIDLLIKNAKLRKGRKIEDKFFSEIYQTYYNNSNTAKKHKYIYDISLTNRAFLKKK
jgi:ribosomal protein S7